MKARLTVATITASLDFAEKHCASGDHDKLRMYFVSWLRSELSQSARPAEVALAARIDAMLSLQEPEVTA
jgi:hypothetical protein